MIPGSTSQYLLKVKSNSNLIRLSFILSCIVSFYYIFSFSGSTSQYLLKVKSNSNLIRLSFILSCIVSFYYIFSFLLSCRLTANLLDMRSFSCTFYCKTIIRHMLVWNFIYQSADQGWAWFIILASYQVFF